MRSVFVSNCGDPFLGLFVHKLFKERWYDEVDEFLININNHGNFPKDVESEFLSKLAIDPKINIIYHQNAIGNGLPITEMTLISKADDVLLLEDDGFIFEEGIVDECFKRIESREYDAVGSPRGSCGQEIWEACGIKYNLDYTGYGDVGPTFWPNFFFCKRKDLLRTDLNFASKKFSAGEYYKELDWTFKVDNMGDTFVWACIQLRAMGLEFFCVPQHKADPFEIESYNKKEMNWHPSQQPFKWIHGGSLSAGWNGYLSGRIPEATDDSSIQEMESRCAFWFLACLNTEGFDRFKEKYLEGIYGLITNAKLDQGRISKKMSIYKQLIRI